MKSAARRLVLETVGWILVVAGVAALVLPGPGLLMVFAGLALLSQQYQWAERRVEPVKERALKAAADGVETVPRIMVSVVLSLLIIAAGVLWIWSPPAPDWWPVDDRWWLVGGWGTGTTQVGSGLFALGMIGYSIRRFRVRGEDPSA